MRTSYFKRKVSSPRAAAGSHLTFPARLSPTLLLLAFSLLLFFPMFPSAPSSDRHRRRALSAMSNAEEYGVNKQLRALRAAGRDRFASPGNPLPTTTMLSPRSPEDFRNFPRITVNTSRIGDVTAIGAESTSRRRGNNKGRSSRSFWRGLLGGLLPSFLLGRMSGSTWNDALIRGSSSSRSSNSSSSSSSSSSSNVTSDDENLDRPVVINGEVVGARTSFPFVARLDVFFITFSLGKCGGSLIATRWVLTAGHCLKAFGNLLPSLFVMVTLGDLQRFTPFESGEFKSPGFAKTNSDYYYDKVSNIRNDIGLVWLLFKAPTGDSISPIALPPTTWTTTVGSSVDLVGWGYYKNSPAVNSIISTGSNELRKGTLTVLDDSSCVGLGYTYISSQMICMGPTNNQSPCQGDSGGPVISYSNGIPYLVGVVSWGTDGCPTSSPSVATEVQNYLSWIKSTAGVS